MGGIVFNHVETKDYITGCNKAEQKYELEAGHYTLIDCLEHKPAKYMSFTHDKRV